MPPRLTLRGVTTSAAVVPLVRRLTSSPLATTSPIPTPASAARVLALRTSLRPVRSVTQRYFVTPRGESTPVFSPWGFGSVSRDRSETELLLTYQF